MDAPEHSKNHHNIDIRLRHDSVLVLPRERYSRRKDGSEDWCTCFGVLLLLDRMHDDCPINVQIELIQVCKPSNVEKRAIYCYTSQILTLSSIRDIIPITSGSSFWDSRKIKDVPANLASVELELDQLSRQTLEQPLRCTYLLQNPNGYKAPLLSLCYFFGPSCPSTKGKVSPPNSLLSIYPIVLQGIFQSRAKHIE